MMRIKLDGVCGKVEGDAWVAHGFLTLVVFSEEAKLPKFCPHCNEQVNNPCPSGYVTTYNIPINEIKLVLEEEVKK